MLRSLAFQKDKKLQQSEMFFNDVFTNRLRCTMISSRVHRLQE